MSTQVEVSKASLPHMASVERFSKLPVVEQTVDLASNLYEKVKETSPIVSSVLSTAENTLKGAVDKSIPVAGMLERPIKVVDSLLCSSLDFVENNIPGVKLPAEEMYSNTKDYVFGLPVVKCACQLGQQGALKAVECVCAVSEYGTAKLQELKGSLQDIQSSEANDLRASNLAPYLTSILSTYLFVVTDLLFVVSNYVGKNSGAAPNKSIQPNNTNKKVANGSHFNDSEGSNNGTTGTENN